ncbi:MAG: hypothetical protein IJS97_08965 [Prevotella sp.]|nr:hypothetical protein [Prevotella sp.]
MLNIELIEDLYAKLTHEEQQKLLSQLFKGSKQGLNYFRRTKDISMSKLEILADFFHLPLDVFRKTPSYNIVVPQGPNSELFQAAANIMTQARRLNDELETLNAILQNKQKELNVQNDLLETLRERVGNIEK